jgi:glycosyltransferase involved in cell wall biosynthesis
MVIKNYMGFSWNPGVKRLRDWKILPNGYSEFEREHLIDKYYKDKGYSVVSISENDNQGYVKHLGWGRRADNPVLKKEVGISVIMPSFLGEYSGSRKNPEDKFKRAIQSFKNQSHNKKELIIISDGCEITNEIYEKNYSNDPVITIVKVEKRKEKWPGELREVGRSISKYNWITYLDTDDYILKDHLEIISKNIKDLKGNETVIFNMKQGLPILNEGNDLYYKYLGMGKDELKNFSEKIKPTEGLGKIAWAKSKNNDHVGTWQITHHKYISTRWKNSLHMGIDTIFIKEIKQTEKWKEFVGRYVVCHMTYNREHIWDI